MTLENETETPVVEQVLARHVLRDVHEIRQSFRSARFYPHAVIDDFLNDEICRGLIEEFPRYRAEDATNELGEVGRKAYREDITVLGPTYARVDEMLKSREFLDLMSEITGTPDLLYDPDYIGGGTHENLPGAQLDTHVDFNIHPATGWHRRLNLILFLNEEWDPAWGGCLGIYGDPWARDGGEFEIAEPKLNRCLIFETSEISWHGFDRIEIPPDRPDLTRKTLAVYLYSVDRPAEEIAPPHATFYVPQRLPDRFVPGMTLDVDDFQLVRELLGRRDDQIHFLYEREKEFSGKAEELAQALRERLLFGGALRQTGPAMGVYDDLWAQGDVEIPFRVSMPVGRLVLEGFVPDFLPSTRRISLAVGDVIAEHKVAHGMFECPVELPLDPGATGSLRIHCDTTFDPKEDGHSGDSRELAFVLRGVHGF